jgi:anti-anti-sigma regulatory factor
MNSSVAGMPGLAGRPRLRLAPAAFTVNVNATGSCRASLGVHGRLGAKAGELLSGVLSSQLAANRRFVRVDMGGLTSADPEVIATLLQCHARFLTAHGSVIFTNVSRQAASLFTTNGADQVLLTTTASADQTWSGPRLQAASPVTDSGQPVTDLARPASS